MNVLHTFRKVLLPALVPLIATTGCDDDDATGPGTEGDAPFAVVLQSQNVSEATLAAAGVPEPYRAVIGLGMVEAIVLPIGEVQAHHEGEGWVSAGFVNEDVDLMNLPAEGLVLVDSDLPEGEYDGLRLFLSDEPWIVLSGDVQVGRTTFEAGVHDLEIPSSAQSGVKLNAGFDLDDDGELLTVLYDGQASVQKVTATGSGVLKIRPVLTVRNEDGTVVGDLDDPDEEWDVEFEGVLDALDDDVLTLEDGTTVVVGADTEIDGDILTLTDLATAFLEGATIHAEGEGMLDEDGSTILATRVVFDVED